jgi:2-keto-3-deoxy-L-rhamnonate aldolase RhmA
MVETLEAIGNIDDLLAVEGIDVFFIGPGDLSQNMGYPPAPPFGQPRPRAVIDKVGFTVDKIRAAGKIAGTLVRSSLCRSTPQPRTTCRGFACSAFRRDRSKKNSKRCSSKANEETQRTAQEAHTS